MATQLDNAPPRFVLTDIPATKQGRAFIAQFRQYLNREGYTMRLRGTGPHPEGRRSFTRPKIKDSKAFQVYLDSAFERDYMKRFYDVQAQRDDWARTAVDLEKERDEASHTASCQRDIIRKYQLDKDELTRDNMNLIQINRRHEAHVAALNDVPNWVVRLCRFIRAVMEDRA